MPTNTNRIAVGLLAGQGWQAKRAYPVYGMQRGNNAIGVGLLLFTMFLLPQISPKCLPLYFITSMTYMPQTLCSLLIHGVFHKKTSAPCIRREDQKRLNAFVQKTCETYQCPCLIVNGPGDHLHFLVLLSQEVTLSHLIKEIKRTSTLFLKECDGAYYHHFHWQSGYGGFSVSEKLKNVVYEYILRQEEHHKKRSMYDEFEMLLKNAGITQYENRYYWQ